MKVKLIIAIAMLVSVLAIAAAQGSNAALIQNMLRYQAESHHGSVHVERWTRTLAALGHGSHANPMTASEAQTYANRGWRRWDPVVTALRQLENSQPQPTQAPQPTPQPTQAPRNTGGNPWDTVYGPSWVDGTNCFWWPDTETVKVREFSTFNFWTGVTYQGHEPPAWTNAQGSYLASDINALPSAIEFQIGNDATYRVTRFYGRYPANSIKDYIDAWVNTTATYADDAAACAAAHLYFRPDGNFR